MDEKLTYTSAGVEYEAEVARITEVELTTRNFRLRVDNIAGNESWIVLTMDLTQGLGDFDRIVSDLEAKFDIYRVGELKDVPVLVLKQNGRSVGIKGLSKGMYQGPVIF